MTSQQLQQFINDADSMIHEHARQKRFIEVCRDYLDGVMRKQPPTDRDLEMREAVVLALADVRETEPLIAEASRKHFAAAARLGEVWNRVVARQPESPGVQTKTPARSKGRNQTTETSNGWK